MAKPTARDANSRASAWARVVTTSFWRAWIFDDSTLMKIRAETATPHMNPAAVNAAVGSQELARRTLVAMF